MIVKCFMYRETMNMLELKMEEFVIFLKSYVKLVGKFEKKIKKFQKPSKGFGRLEKFKSWELPKGKETFNPHVNWS